jgi:hypothetical protein
VTAKVRFSDSQAPTDQSSGWSKLWWRGEIALWTIIVISILNPIAPALAARGLPKPLPDHPGNIFLEGEDVTVAIPSGKGGRWQLHDYENEIVRKGTNVNSKVTLGKLPVGYYELRNEDSGNTATSRITIGVLSPLTAPTPLTSPIGADVAMAQLIPGVQQRAIANLCALAGMNWVRDRFWWRELEPEKGRFVKNSVADDPAKIQSGASLQVLQVHCDTPTWAGQNPKRFPTDLRDAYQFMKTAAARWHGKVLAFEPWNEADTPNFGGHIGTELAAYQKACYLGLKAGNPDAIVCQNVFASPHPNVLADFNANSPGPYFDTFNFHHYCPADEYSAVYTVFRAASAGKPLWVTEFNLPVTWSGNDKDQEPSDANLRVQAERVAQLFASALYQDPAVALYFLLSNYSEGQVQYGVLHGDLTPRPAFLALAAVGRLLADAKSLGRLRSGDALRAFAFRARPDGEEREVIVAWTTSDSANVELPVKPLAIFDHLGRPQTNIAGSVQLSPAPSFVICKKDSLSAIPMQPPPAKPPLKPGKPSSVVLQVLVPESKTDMNLSAYASSSAKPESISLFAYNFGREKVAGDLVCETPVGWSVNILSRIELRPNERKELTAIVDTRGGTTTPSDRIRIRGDFGLGGESVVSFRLAARPFTIVNQAGVPLPNAGEPERWQPAGDGLKITKVDGGVGFQAKPGADQRSAFPLLTLVVAERPITNSLALAATVTVSEGAGDFRVIFEEENGSAYFAPLYPQPKADETVEALALFESALHGEGWSAPDDNGQLDVEKIRGVRIGCNSNGKKIVYTIKNVRWLKRPTAGR